MEMGGAVGRDNSQGVWSVTLLKFNPFGGSAKEKTLMEAALWNIRTLNSPRTFMVDVVRNMYHRS